MFDEATTCHICSVDFYLFEDEIGKENPEWGNGPPVADHDHVTGVFRGAAHNSCNLNYRLKWKTVEVPCWFHNLKNYDAHHLIKGAKKRHVQIRCIPNNMEKLICFSIGGVTFKDSFAFMSSSLDSLVSNLEPEQLMNIRRYLEMIEIANRSKDDDDVESVQSTNEDDELNTDDEDFINDHEDDAVLMTVSVRTK